MSQEDVDALRNGNAAFRNGDGARSQANMDPDILIRTDPRRPQQRIYGRQAALAFYRGLWESGGPDLRIDEIVDLGIAF